MLNLRRIPSSEGAVLGMLPNGAHTRPLLDMGEWMLVDCNGTRGYLMTQYIARPEEESAVYRRGRNAKVHGIPPKSSVAEYHSATGLEALFGWLYLLGRRERLSELFAHITEE